VCDSFGYFKGTTVDEGDRLTTEDFSWCGTVPSADALKRAATVKLIVTDIDGVQTNGCVYYLPSSSGVFETKGFDSHDGLALHMLKRAGIKYGAISGRSSAAVAERASNMGFDYIYQGHLDKIPILQEILTLSNLSPSEIAYVGDDFTDVPLMKRVGLACAVANARAEVKTVAHFITATRGGEGALREVVELVLKATSKWPEILERYNLQA
jgi:3-deoxy-D-manno-octulosonate 8-phosphate phosphatase (KDO 8-P phosphatase)